MRCNQILAGGDLLTRLRRGKEIFFDDIGRLVKPVVGDGFGFESHFSWPHGGYICVVVPLCSSNGAAASKNNLYKSKRPCLPRLFLQPLILRSLRNSTPAQEGKEVQLTLTLDTSLAVLFHEPVSYA